jgi:pyruvate/2-oxoglutarate dehydrogenase complex dihydrolipoamide acyltransferase (E2) component
MARNLEGDGFSEVEAATQDPRMAIGGNNPPTLLMGDDLLRSINERYADILKEADDCEEAVKLIPTDKDGNLLCSDEAWLKKLSDFVKKIRRCVKKLDGARTAEIVPYDQCRDIVHNRFRECMDTLVSPDTGRRKTEKIKERVERAMDEYNTRIAEAERKRREDEARIQREREDAERRKREAAEAEARAAAQAAADLAAAAARKRNAETKAAADEAARIAREASEKFEREAAKRREDEQAAAAARSEAERAASATSQDLTRVRGGSSVSSQTEFVNWRDLIREKLDLEALRAHLPASALESAVTSYLKANKDTIKDELTNKRQPLRGVIFFVDTKTVSR